MTLFQAFGQFAGQAAVAAIAPGMVLVKPASIAYSGTSATLGADGQVTFTDIDSVSLNGVFTADFDNYVLSYRIEGSTPGAGNTSNNLRMRASGTDETGSNYICQRLYADATVSGADRNTLTQWGPMNYTSEGEYSGNTILIYNPFLAQATAIRSITASYRVSATIYDLAGTHTVASSYDGATLSFTTGEFVTGAVQMYGVRS